jgi:hypothetical protein
MKRIVAALLFGLALFAAPSAFAQSIMQCAYNSSPPTVTSPSAVSVQCSNTGYILFSPASGSLQNVNINQILGAAPSLTNPLWVAPATGATFAVTQGTASNLNATVVGTGGAALATSALQTTGNTALSTINTTLGTPFQAGGSIGNTSFGATQSGTWNITNVTGTVSLPTGAATSALQSTGNSTLSTINTTLGSPFQAGGAVSVSAGSAIIGKVGIDQTTPGTTNGVQTLTGSTTAVTQTTPSNLNATVVGTGTFATQTTAGPSNVTLTDCSGSLSTGGTAQNAFAAQTTLHGFQIMNLSTDLMWVSFTTTAAAATAGSYPLNPGTSTSAGGSYSTPYGLGTNHALSVVAATTGDKFSCTWW